MATSVKVRGGQGEDYQALSSAPDTAERHTQSGFRKPPRRANSAPQPTDAAGPQPLGTLFTGHDSTQSHPTGHYYSPQFRPSAAGARLPSVSPQYVLQPLPPYPFIPQAGVGAQSFNPSYTPSPVPTSFPISNRFLYPRISQSPLQNSVGQTLPDLGGALPQHVLYRAGSKGFRKTSMRFTAIDPFSHHPKIEEESDSNLTFDDIPAAGDAGDEPPAKETPHSKPPPSQPIGLIKTPSVINADLEDLSISPVIPESPPRPSMPESPDNLPTADTPTASSQQSQFGAPPSPRKSVTSDKNYAEVHFETSLPSSWTYDDLEAAMHYKPLPIWPRVSGLMFGTMPRQIYLTILLRIPAMYFSRVARIFEETDLTLPEMKRLALEAGIETMRDPSEFNALKNLPPQFYKLKSTWESFIDSLMREWKIANVIAVLLLSAILTTLQIDSAANDPVSRYTALAALICGLLSLLFGGMYIVRFGSMRKINRAAEWSLEARKSKTGILWNVWIMLAMPAVWPTWSILLYIACVMSFVWRTNPHDDVPALSLSYRTLLIIKILLSAVFGFGVLNGILILGTFRHYGNAMDQKWKRRLDGWLQEKISRPSLFYPYGPSAVNSPWRFPPDFQPQPMFTWVPQSWAPQVYNPADSQPVSTQPPAGNDNDASNEDRQNYSLDPGYRPPRPDYARPDREHFSATHVSKRPEDWSRSYHPDNSEIISSEAELERGAEKGIDIQGGSQLLRSPESITSSDPAPIMTLRDIAVHPMLDWENNSIPPMQWDLEKPPFSDDAIAFLPPLNNDTILDISATNPTSLSLSLHHPSLPWQVDVYPGFGPHVQLHDVLVQLFDQLRTPIAARHYWNKDLDDADRTKILKAFKRRTEGNQDLQNKGIMQIDYLGEEHFFDGLVKGSDGRWEMKLVSRAEIEKRPRILHPIQEDDEESRSFRRDSRAAPSLEMAARTEDDTQIGRSDRITGSPMEEFRSTREQWVKELDERVKELEEWQEVGRKQGELLEQLRTNAGSRMLKEMLTQPPPSSSSSGGGYNQSQNQLQIPAAFSDNVEPIGEDFSPMLSPPIQRSRSNMSTFSHSMYDSDE